MNNNQAGLHHRLIGGVWTRYIYIDGLFTPPDHCRQGYMEVASQYLDRGGGCLFHQTPEATGFSLTLIHTSGGIRTLDETNPIIQGNNQTSRARSVWEHSDLPNPYIDFVCQYWSRLSSKSLTSKFPSTRQNSRHRTAMHGAAVCQI